MKWTELILAKPAPAKKGEVNYGLVDRFTLVHFAIGVGYGFLDFSLLVTFFLSILWEFAENPLKVHLSIIFPHSTADTPQNMVGDTLAVMVGWFAHWHFMYPSN